MASYYRRIATVLLLAASAGAAAAATSPIGEAKKVVPAASSEGEAGAITLVIGASLFQDDRVKTGNLGRAGLQFLDQTELEVGPNSTAKLDRFVFNPDRTASEVSINLAKGAFRFVSGGHARPNTYTLTTPHATLGLRGTIVEVLVTDINTRVKFTEGEGEVCTPGGDCRILDAQSVNAAIITITGFIETYTAPLQGQNNAMGPSGSGSLDPVGTTSGAGGGTGSGTGGLFPSDGSTMERCAESPIVSCPP